jgi:hypothetical protein
MTVPQCAMTVPQCAMTVPQCAMTVPRMRDDGARECGGDVV